MIFAVANSLYRLVRLATGFCQISFDTPRKHWPTVLSLLFPHVWPCQAFVHDEQSVTGTVHRSGYFHSVVKGPKFVRALGIAVVVHDRIDVYVEDRRSETRSSGQEMAKDKRIDQGEKSERLSPSVIPVSSVLLHHTCFPFEALQAYLRPPHQWCSQ